LLLRSVQVMITLHQEARLVVQLARTGGRCTRFSSGRNPSRRRCGGIWLFVIA